jgi:hypothetical protein
MASQVWVLDGGYTREFVVRLNGGLRLVNGVAYVAVGVWGSPERVVHRAFTKP